MSENYNESGINTFAAQLYATMNTEEFLEKEELPEEIAKNTNGQIQISNNLDELADEEPIYLWIEFTPAFSTKNWTQKERDKCNNIAAHISERLEMKGIRDIWDSDPSAWISTLHNGNLIIELFVQTIDLPQMVETDEDIDPQEFWELYENSADFATEADQCIDENELKDVCKYYLSK